MTPLSRRDFAKLTLAATALPFAPSFARAAAAKPDSKVRGVQIGLNVPYSFRNPTMSGDEILDQCVKLGLSAVELRTQPVEAFLGAPQHLVSEKAKLAPAGAADQLRAWRKSAPVARAADFRRRYEDAGVRVEIVKVDGIFKMSDAELDYVFALGQALGARALSTEISKSDDDHARVGKFADRHQLMIGYHGHATTTPEHWEKAFALAKFNGANVDLGHFIAGNEGSVLDFLKKHHARITHVHVKDRKKKNGPNMPFGQGDTPIAEALRLIRDNRWPIQATIEFEYPVPATSDRMTEIARAIQYCRDALNA